MNDQVLSSARTRRRLRQAGLAVGSVVAGFWVLIGALLLLAGDDPWTWESGVLASLIVASAVAVAVAWRRQRLGGLLVLVCGAGHSLFAYVASGHNRGFAMSLAGLPLLLAGALLLAGLERYD